MVGNKYTYNGQRLEGRFNVFSRGDICKITRVSEDEDWFRMSTKFLNLTYEQGVTLSELERCFNRLKIDNDEV